MLNSPWGVGARSRASAIGTILVLATGSALATTGCWGPDHNRGVYVEPPRHSHEEHQEHQEHREEHHEDHRDDHHQDGHRDDHGH